MNTKVQLSSNTKVNIIFDFLFNSEYHLKEEYFWNTLSQKEIKRLEKIKQEKTISFSELKQQL